MAVSRLVPILAAGLCLLVLAVDDAAAVGATNATENVVEDSGSAAEALPSNSEVAAALSCVVCINNGTSDERCVPNDLDIEAHEDLKQECDVTAGQNACFKTINIITDSLTDTTYSLVERGCVKSDKNECVQRITPGGSYVHCRCDTHYCNGVTPRSPTLGIAFALTIAASLLARL